MIAPLQTQGARLSRQYVLQIIDDVEVALGILDHLRHLGDADRQRY